MIILLLLALTTGAEARPHHNDHHPRPHHDRVESHVVDRRHGNDVMVVTHWVGPFRFTFVHDVPDRDRPRQSRPSHRGVRRPRC
jgi:hypothetical protein